MFHIPYFRVKTDNIMKGLKENNLENSILLHYTTILHRVCIICVCICV